MKLFDYVYIWALCSVTLTEVVLKESSDLPLEWAELSNRDVFVVTSHLLVLFYLHCIGAFFSYVALVVKPKFWAIFCILQIVYLMADMSEMDARTGVPLEEETGARHYIHQAVMENKSFKETLIRLFQYARPVPRAQTCPLNVDVVFSYKCQVINISTHISNIILAVHFQVITNEHFMIVF